MSDSERSGTAMPEVEKPEPTAPQQPLLRVVNSDASPEEIAAIVAVFASLGGGQAPARPARPQWSNPARYVRGAAAGSWRTSALPR